MEEIRQAVLNGYILSIHKLKNPVFGGYYVFEMRYDEHVYFKDGLNLDAANELFFKEVKTLNRINLI